MDKNLIAIMKITVPIYVVIGGVIGLAIAYQKRENEAANYCMNHVYSELSRINTQLDDLTFFPEEPIH